VHRLRAFATFVRSFANRLPMCDDTLAMLKDSQLPQLRRIGERTLTHSMDDVASAAPELDGYHYLWDKSTLYGKLHVGAALPLPELCNPKTVAKADQLANSKEQDLQYYESITAAQLLLNDLKQAQDALPREFRKNDQANARPLLPTDIPSALGKRKAHYDPAM